MQAVQNQTPKYSRRRPELTPCYKILQGHLNTFIADRAAEDRPLPKYVVEEFDAFMRCGIPAFGFLRLKCSCCKEEKIVAFSCKKRGFCPSCCAKRQAEAATHLISNVLPFIPYRQFVISFPIPMRYWLQTNKKLYSKIHALLIREIHRHYTNKAKSSGIKGSTPGSISFTQRWGSALNLNPHAHVLCADGVYTWVNGKPRWNNMEKITDQEVSDLITKISQSVMLFLRKQGYLDKDGDVVQNPLADGLFQENAALSLATQNSVNGFSLHANTAFNTLQREPLRKLIEYIARGPLSNERLQIDNDGKVQLQLKTKWSDGTTHLLFTPGEFIEKLTALIPLPKSHLVRWAGVFAPNSKYRKEITLKPDVKKGFQFKGDDEKGGLKNYSWSKMLAQVFKIDVTKCESCGADMVALGSVKDRDQIKRYLNHIGLDPDPPPMAPARSWQESLDFDQSPANRYEEPTIHLD